MIYKIILHTYNNSTSQMISYAIVVFGNVYYIQPKMLILKQSKMRVSKRYNKHKSFNLRKKSTAVNKNKVKKIKIQIMSIL
jgi:hypothetical protein